MKIAGIFFGASCTGGILPFRFGGQALALQGAEPPGFGEPDMLHRQIRTDQYGRITAYDLFVCFLRRFGLIEIEGTQADFMDRSFAVVFFMIIINMNLGGPHLETSFRDQNHTYWDLAGVGKSGEKQATQNQNGEPM